MIKIFLTKIGVTPYNETSKEKNVTVKDQNYSPIRTGVYYSTLHQGGNIKRPSTHLSSKIKNDYNNHVSDHFSRTVPQKNTLLKNDFKVKIVSIFL